MAALSVPGKLRAVRVTLDQPGTISIGPTGTNPVCEDCCFCPEPKPVLEESRRHVSPQLKSHHLKKRDAGKPAAHWAGNKPGPIR